MLITLTTVISIFITSCAEEEENKSNTTPSVYKVSVISGEGGTAKTSETELIPGWEVTITATPEETYRFVNWTVGGKEVSKENPYTIAINQNTQFKANFEKDNYTLKVTAGEGGVVKASQEGIVLNGTKVTLTATPNEGYSFVNWTVNGEEVSKENPYTVTVTGDIEYVANFISYKVTVIAGEGGTATANKTQVAPNGQVTLTATPNVGYIFVNWTVDDKEVSTQPTYTATIIEDTEFKANFIITHKVTAVADEGGTTKVSKSQVEHGGQVMLTATPNEGYSFVNWTVNGVEVSRQSTYTATITSDTEFKANFITHKVTVISGEGGTATANKTQVGHNGQVTLTATPNEGYSFVNWTVNGEEVSTSATYTVTVTNDIEYVANFISYKVTVLSGEGGTATANKTQVGYNGKVTLTATPNEDYHFINWTVNGEEVSKENSYTVSVTSDMEYKANFILKYVDLGLSVKWASCNMGATYPEHSGFYYNYILRPNMDGESRMPTLEETKELLDSNNCIWEWTTQNNTNGYRITSKINGNSIFLPAAGEVKIHSSGNLDMQEALILGKYTKQKEGVLGSYFIDNDFYVDWNGFDAYHLSYIYFSEKKAIITGEYCSNLWEVGISIRLVLP